MPMALPMVAPEPWSLQWTGPPARCHRMVGRGFAFIAWKAVLPLSVFGTNPITGKQRFLPEMFLVGVSRTDVKTGGRQEFAMDRWQGHCASASPTGSNRPPCYAGGSTLLHHPLSLQMVRKPVAQRALRVCRSRARLRKRARSRSVGLSLSSICSVSAAQCSRSACRPFMGSPDVGDHTITGVLSTGAQ